MSKGQRKKPSSNDNDNKENDEKCQLQEDKKKNAHQVHSTAGEGSVPPGERGRGGKEVGKDEEQGAGVDKKEKEKAKHVQARSGKGSAPHGKRGHGDEEEVGEDDQQDRTKQAKRSKVWTLMKPLLQDPATCDVALAVMDEVTRTAQEQAVAVAVAEKDKALAVMRADMEKLELKHRLQLLTAELLRSRGLLHMGGLQEFGEEKLSSLQVPPKHSRVKVWQDILRLHPDLGEAIEEETRWKAHQIPQNAANLYSHLSGHVHGQQMSQEAVDIVVGAVNQDEARFLKCVADAVGVRANIHFGKQSAA